MNIEIKNGRLIDPATGPLDQFRIELPVIHPALSCDSPDKEAVFVPQQILLIVQRDRRLLLSLSFSGGLALIRTDQGIEPGHAIERNIFFQ